MKIKDGVSLAGIRPQCRDILITANRIWLVYGQELVITEAMGGIHSPGSCHYYGFALDLRTRYFDDETKAEVFDDLRAALKSTSEYYDVVLHKSHIHAEFDIFRWMKDHQAMQIF